MFCCALSVKSKFDMRKSVVVSEKVWGASDAGRRALYVAE